MTKFQIGDRVVINEEGFRRYSHVAGCKGEFGNPKCEGTIIRIYGDGWVKATWDNGSFNSYDPVTLDLVISSLENE